MGIISATCPVCRRVTSQSLLRAATSASPPMVQCGTCGTMWEMLADGNARCEFLGGETAIHYERDFQGYVVQVTNGGNSTAANVGFYPLYDVETDGEGRRPVWGRYLRRTSGNTFVSHFADFLHFLSRDQQFMKGGWMLHDHPILLRGMGGETGRVILPGASDVWVAYIGGFSVSITCAETHYEAVELLSRALRRSLEYERPRLTVAVEG